MIAKVMPAMLLRNVDKIDEQQETTMINPTQVLSTRVMESFVYSIDYITIHLYQYIRSRFGTSRNTNSFSPDMILLTFQGTFKKIYSQNSYQVITTIKKPDSKIVFWKIQIRDAINKTNCNSHCKKDIICQAETSNTPIINHHLKVDMCTYTYTNATRKWNSFYKALIND